jgi:hypothetical protein
MQLRQSGARKIDRGRKNAQAALVGAVFVDADRNGDHDLVRSAGHAVGKNKDPDEY